MVDGRILHFHLAGINNQNFIMQDIETGSWWQQVSGIAIQGPLKGKQLEPQAWDEVSFSHWKQEYPRSLVLRGTGKYQSEYAPADWDTRILKRPTVTPVNANDPLKPRDLVVGIRVGAWAKAYPLEEIRINNPIVDVAGATPFVLVLDADGMSVRCFDRRIGERTIDLFLKPNATPLKLFDAQTGSEWDFSGKAISGPMMGKKLIRLQSLKDFWFDWKVYHPNTQVFGRGVTRMEPATGNTNEAKQGWIRMIGMKEATGPLKELYDRMQSNKGSRPAVYNTPSGDAANIVKSHSLDPEGLQLAFGLSGAIHWGPKSLPWVQREMLNTVTSGTNNCFY